MQTQIVCLWPFHWFHCEVLYSWRINCNWLQKVRQIDPYIPCKSSMSALFFISTVCLASSYFVHCCVINQQHKAILTPLNNNRTCLQLYHRFHSSHARYVVLFLLLMHSTHDRNHFYSFTHPFINNNFKC